jgi:predicted dinucleotide-utilizing enzyme
VLATDPGYAAKLNALTPHAKTILEVGCAVLVVAVGFFLQHRAKQKHKAHDPVDLAADKGKE